MTPQGLDCLRAAVGLARDERIASVPALKARLKRAGFEDATITEALKCWAQYEVSKRDR